MLEKAYGIFSAKKATHASPTKFNACFKDFQGKSCFLSTVNDTLSDILMASYDIGMISKQSGGNGLALNRLRHGKIEGGDGGRSDGLLPWIKNYESTMKSCNQKGKRKGALVLGIVNAVGSTIARTTDAGIYLHVGPEIGVARTKAITAQVAVLTMLAIELGRRKHISSDQAAEHIETLYRIPEMITEILTQSDHIAEIAKANIDKDNWLFLGRGFNYPVALEGALKLKEISYIHAEGLPAAEMKHGPIALIVDDMPAVFIATKGPQYSKTMGNIAEVKARGGKIIAVATQGDENIKQFADYLITIPDVPELLQPMLTVIPLQLLAYHAAVLRGHDVDKPRNLAKSVTVE